MQKENSYWSAFENFPWTPMKTALKVAKTGLCWHILSYYTYFFINVNFIKFGCSFNIPPFKGQNIIFWPAILFCNYFRNWRICMSELYCNPLTVCLNNSRLEHLYLLILQRLNLVSATLVTDSLLSTNYKWKQFLEKPLVLYTLLHWYHLWYLGMAHWYHYKRK